MVDLGEFSLDRMVRAVEKVRERLLRATAALNQHQVPYAIIGGNAVAAWVSRVDEAAVRNTQDVDILIRREDLPLAKTALENAGFVYRHAASIDMFLDGPDAKARDAVHVIFAAERVRPEYLLATPNVDEVDEYKGYSVLNLESLVRMKLTSNRRKDQVHVLDLIDVGLIDQTWVARFPTEIGQRLQTLLDDPSG
ncbi:nucleotidyltransferase family protein [Anatilimnocola floriformis]|uniref:nucleotidyltransferase family protein n=1 Tax=Anatilimnocola floriformis TaxID=2948575 RepID=UPI0020C4CE4C|nr:nucleotidyltransferase family protein [Anatilimnocola floriformis]